METYMTYAYKIYQEIPLLLRCYGRISEPITFTFAFLPYRIRNSPPKKCLSISKSRYRINCWMICAHFSRRFSLMTSSQSDVSKQTSWNKIFRFIVICCRNPHGFLKCSSSWEMEWKPFQKCSSPPNSTYLFYDSMWFPKPSNFFSPFIWS